MIEVPSGFSSVICSSRMDYGCPTLYFLKHKTKEDSTEPHKKPRVVPNFIIILSGFLLGLVITRILGFYRESQFSYHISFAHKSGQ